MLGTTDWLLKRFLKFVLKRNVGKYLTSEIDLEQLDVKLDTGKLELKNLLLNCDAVNKDLALDGWHVKAGYVGSVNAKLPSIFSSTSQCSVVVNEVMLTIAPAPAAATPGAAGACAAGSPDRAGTAAAFPQDIPSAAPAPPAASAAGGAMSFLLADDFGWTGHVAVMDGIKRIAGSLQSLLQHMRLEASDVLIRIELPHPSEKGRVVTAALKLDLVEFGDLASLPAASLAGPAGAPQQQQHQHNDIRGQAANHKTPPGTSPRPHVGPGDASHHTGTATSATAAAATGAAAGRREIAKHIQVKGLSLDLFETTPLLTGAAAAAADVVVATGKAAAVASNSVSASPPAQVGSGAAAAAATGVTLVSGPGKHGLQLSVELRMVLSEHASSQATQITTDIRIGAVRLQLLPSHAVCLSALKAALDRRGIAADVTAAADGGGGSSELWASPYASASAASLHSAAGHWGRRSLFESFMAPNCEGVVAHSLEPYMTGAGLSYGDANEFHDACSRFGSLASSLVSSVTQTGTNLLGYVAASGSAAVGGAMDWMGAVPPPPSHDQLPAAPMPAMARAGGDPQPSPPVAPAAVAAATPQAPQPIVSVRAHVSHAAIVMCYGSPPPAQQQQQQHSTVSRKSFGTHPGTTGGRATGAGSSPGSAVRGALNGAAAALSSSSGVTHGSAGSLVAELQDLSCDVRLDAAHGNMVALEAGQLQVYEQLPAAVGARYGMTPAEWCRVPEVLPQAPYRFRPTQPAPSRTSGGGTGGAAAVASTGGCSPRVGMTRQQPGRNAHATAAAAAGGGMNSAVGGSAACVLQTWPILLCASTHTSGGMAAQQQPQQPSSHVPQGPMASSSHGGKPAANRHAAQPGAGAPGGAGNAGGGGGGGAGHGCLRLRASWGGGGGGAAAADCAGYGRYGSEGLPAAPSYELSVEMLPVTVWLSLPLVQRLTEFAAPMVSEPGKAAGSVKSHHHHHHHHRAVVPPKPPGPLPRMSLTVVAPHVCVLLALVPASPPTAAPPPRPPGTPVFIALDVVSSLHPAVESATHGSHGLHGPHHAPHHGHPQQQPPPPQHYHNHHHHHHPPYQQPVYATHNGAAAPLAYGPYGSAAPHGGYGGSHQVYGAPSPPPHSSYGNGWAGAGSHGYAAPQQGRVASSGSHWAASLAWAAPEPPPLLTIYQAPATDRLIPSQVTTIDLAAGVMELMLVRTAAAEGAARDRPLADAAPASGPAAAQPHLWASDASGARSAAASSWTSKSLLSLSPAPPQAPTPAPTSRRSWDAPHAAPPTGPADVPSGCGLHLHVCADPGVGTAPDLVSEAWGHVAAHAQDRWADPDGEGGAWEERSSFRSVAFHERCRKSSATFLHLHAPKALLHLTRADLADLAALPAVMQPPPPPPAAEASANAAAGATSRQQPPRPASTRNPSSARVAPPTPGGPAPQTCVLVEIGLRIQLQDDSPAAVPAGGAPAAAAAANAAPLPLAAAAAAGGPSQGLGLVLGGSRVSMYELVLEEVTVFRANDLGSQAGCNVTSVHAHGLTLLGHLEQPHRQLQQQLQHAATVAAAAAAAAAGQAGLAGAGGAGAAAGGLRAADSRQQRTAHLGHGLHPPAVAASVPGAPYAQHAPPPGQVAAPPPRSQSSFAAAQQQHAICLLHCPAATAAADSKQPSYIEYVFVDGRRPPVHEAGRRCGGGGGASSGGAAHGGADGGWSDAHQQQQQQLTAPAWSRRSSDSDAPGGGGSAAASAVHSVLLQGVTVSTDHGYVTMDWAVQLGKLLEALAPPTSTRAAAAPSPRGDGGGGGGTAHLSVNVVDLALRHEPMDYPTAAAATGSGSSGAAAAAVGGSAAAAAASGSGGGGRVSPVALALIIEAIHVGLPLGVAEQVPYTPAVHTVGLHSLTLHLAAADQRGPSWAATDPRAIRESLLQACGYHRVLQETSIKVVAKQRRYLLHSKAPVPPSDANVAAAAAAAAEPPALAPPPADDADADEAEGQFHSTLDVEITNQHLLGMLTVESATLLAHFAMQAGTLMTARQAAAVAAAATAAGAPPRRDLNSRPVSGCGPADMYWDAASDTSSSAVAFGGGGTCVSSEAGGDAAGCLLTALLMEEVDENAFRRTKQSAPPPLAGAGALAGGDGAAFTIGHGGGWYTAPGGAADGAAAAAVAGLAPGGLILIDDFFPVNHQGEYDEDLTLVQYPPKGGSAAWRRDGAKAELEGTWYGPDEGPDKRRTGPGPNAALAAAEAAAASSLPLGAFAVAQNGYSQRAGGGGGGDDFDTEVADAHGMDSCSGAFADVDLGLGLVGAGGFLSSGLDGGSEDPDIDDLLMATDPRDGGADPRVSGSAAGAARRAPPSIASAGSSAATRASSAARTWRLQENYVRAPRKSDEDGTGGCGAGASAAIGATTAGAGAAGADLLSSGGPASGGYAALGSGGGEQPPPVSRVTFKDLSGIWVMHTTRSAAAGGGGAAPAAGTAGGGAGGSASGQQEGRVELVVEGLGLVLESYGPGGHLARHMKLTVHDLEIRDCAMEVKQQQAAAAAGARPLARAAVAAAGGGGASGGGSGWIRVLGYRAVRGQPRDSRAPLVALALTAVRPNPAACDPRDEEFRLAVALLPLRLKLNQDIMSYLTWYGTSVSNALKPAAAVLAGMQAALSELDGCEPLPPPYFQRAQIRGFSVMLDYRPRRVDIGALAEGHMLELLNLVPLGGVDLVCKPLRLAGVQGWDGVGAAVLREWLNDIARTQAHKFITGLAPVNAVVKVGSAVATLVSAPARHLARRDGAAATAGRQLAAQLRRTSATFAYRLVCEAMLAGRKAAAGAGKALARVGNTALGAAAYDGVYGNGIDGEDDGEGYRQAEQDGGGDNGDEGDDGEYDEENGDDGDEGADGCEAALPPRRYDSGGGGGAAAAAEAAGMRRSRSASAVVRKGLSRAAFSLGSASQQVAAGLQAGGLQRGVSNVARVLSAAAISGVSAAAPASAALQGQLKGTLRSVRHALRAQLSQGGGSGSGGGGTTVAAAAVGTGGYPRVAAAGPRPKED